MITAASCIYNECFFQVTIKCILRYQNIKLLTLTPTQTIIKVMLQFQQSYYVMQAAGIH